MRTDRLPFFMPPENPVQSSPKNTREIPLHDEIAKRARQLWERNGQPEGRDVEFWLTAERELLGADGDVRIEGNSAVSAQQYEQATDANGAKAKSRKKR